MRQFNYVASSVVIGLSVVMSLANVCHAETINVCVSPLGYTNGVGPAGGGTWNQVDFAVGTTGVLLDSLGNSTTTVTLSLSGAGSDGTAHTGYTTPVNTLLSGYAYYSPWTTPPGGSFAINGLVSGGQYKLYVFSQNGTYDSSKTVFTIGASSLIVDNTLTSDTGSFHEGENYVVFSGLIATGGTISGTFVMPSDNAAFNGFQLVSVPEPGSLLLIVSGICGLLAYAWRKRR
jgi:hypothetical protein